MTTLATGNIVIQNGNERRWMLGDVITDVFGERRWELTCVDPGLPDRNSGRVVVGTTSTAAEEWLERVCSDWAPPVVMPPQGDGVQAAAIFDGDEMVDHELFTTVAAMLEWAERITVGEQGRWYGWDVDAEDLDHPDLTFHINDDNELVWCE